MKQKFEMDSNSTSIVIQNHVSVLNHKRIMDVRRPDSPPTLKNICRPTSYVNMEDNVPSLLISFCLYCEQPQTEWYTSPVICAMLDLKSVQTLCPVWESAGRALSLNGDETNTMTLQPSKPHYNDNHTGVAISLFSDIID